MKTSNGSVVIKITPTVIKKGYDQVKKFSWDKTARETLRALENMGKKM